MHFNVCHGPDTVIECFDLIKDSDLLPTVELTGLKHSGVIMPEGPIELQEELLNRYYTRLNTSNLSKC